MKLDGRKESGRVGRSLVVAITAAAVTALMSGAAAKAADDISELKAQMKALSARLQQLEQEKAKVKALKSEVSKLQEEQKKNPVQLVTFGPKGEVVPVNAGLGQVAYKEDKAYWLETPPALRTDNSGNALGILPNPVMLYYDNKTSLHMYGIIEATLSAQSNQPDATGNHKPTWAYGFQTSWFSGNRLGFDADHALNGELLGLRNLKIIAKMETEFESPTGNFDTPGVLFNRDAWVGFQSPDLGKLTFGRQNTVTRDFTQTWGDPYGTPYVTLKEGGYSNVNNFKQIIFYSASSTLTRNDSAIVWKRSFWDDHVVLGLDYSFGSQGVGGSGNGGIGNTPLLDGGGGNPGNFAVGSNQAISLAFNNFEAGPGLLSFNFNYNRANCGNFGDNHCNAADPSAGNLVNSNINQAFLAGGTYVWNGYRIGAGYIHYDAQQHTTLKDLGDRVDNVWIVDGTIPVIRELGLKDGLPTGSVDFYWGVWGAQSHNSALYAGNNLVVLPFFISTANSTTTVDGSRLNAMASLMYHMDKQTDFYLAYDFQEGFGGWAHHLFNNQGNGDAAHMGSVANGFGTGVRFKF
jgi:predicted porin